MLVLIGLIFGLVVDLFRSRAALEAEILVLRQQIIVLRRSKPTRRPFVAADRLVLGWICRLFPNARNALAIVQPKTVVRWHRAGFRFYWRWKSRRRAGRPVVSMEVRQLIREMSIENPLWGAPRIHGELLKLGINVGQNPRRAHRDWRDSPARRALPLPDQSRGSIHRPASSGTCWRPPRSGSRRLQSPSLQQDPP